MSPRFVNLAVVFYAALFFAAFGVGVLGDRNVLFPGDSPVFGLSLGVGVACGTVALGILAYRCVPIVRKLSDELSRHVLEGTRGGDLVLVAVASGVGEEAFFRGALQPLLGITATSVLFGVLHVGPDRRYLVWTAWAVVAGFLFGFLYVWTGGLLAPVTAHVLHNGATLFLWRRAHRAGER